MLKAVERNRGANFITSDLVKRRPSCIIHPPRDTYWRPVVVWLLAWIAIPAAAQSGPLYTVGHWVVGVDGSIQSRTTTTSESLRLVAGTVVPAKLEDGTTTGAPEPNGGPPRLQPAWNSRSWTTEDGLPHNHIRTLCQSRDGYLWIGTANGLARFDGRRFVVFDEHNTAALSVIGADVRSLMEDGDGRLWVATRAGVGSIKNRAWEVECRPVAGQKHGIRDIVRESSGRVWVATDNGLRQLRDGQLTTYQVPGFFNSALALSIRVVGDQVLWIANSGGVYSWPIDGTRIDTRIEPLSPDSLVNALSVGRNGEVFARSHLALRIWRGDELRVLKLPGNEDAAVSTHVNHVAFGSDGEAWVSLGDRMQLYRGNENGLEPVLFKDGSIMEDVSAIAPDSEGNVWCGTVRGGLVRIRPDRVPSLEVRDPPKHRNVKAVAEGSDGSLWIGTTGGVINWSGTRLEAFEFTTAQDVSGSTPAVFALCKSSAGPVWSGFHSDGIIRLTKTGPVRFPPSRNQDSQFGQVRAMIEAAGGTFWLGTSEGLHEVRTRESETPVDAHLYLAGKDVRAVHEERNGTIWAGTLDAGLWSLPKSSDGEGVRVPRQYTVADGLADQRVWALHQGRDGALWIGTERGLSRLKDGRLVSIRRQDGLGGDQVYGILEDQRGRWWIASRKGIYRIDEAALVTCADGGGCVLESHFIEPADGLLSTDVNGESQHCACRASDGRLYFATSKGVAVVDPDTAGASRQSIPVLIEQVEADGKILVGDGFEEPDAGAGNGNKSPAPGGHHPPDARDPKVDPVIEIDAVNARVLGFRYTANSLTEPKRIHFQHRLQGFMDDWQEGNSERMSRYTNLKPGRYRFQVRAKSYLGTWNEASSGVTVVLRPEYWQTTVFKLGLALFIGTIFALASRWRMKWQKQVLLLEKRMELNNERNRIARDMHDELGARLSELVLQIGGTPADPKVDSGIIMRGVRETLSQLNEVIWAVDPGNDSIQGLADFLTSHGQRYLARAGVRIELNLPSDPGVHDPVPPGLRRHLASMYREILRNVVQHAHAQRVCVTMLRSSESITLRVTDDGCGFDPSGAGRGRGLDHLEQRASELGGTIQIESSPGKGTSICIEIPFRSRR